MNLDQFIRDVPNYPKPGILFKDITPLLAEPKAFTYALDSLALEVAEKEVDALLAIEARGFIFAAPVAAKLSLPLTLARKPGKLPSKTHSAEYALEYGSNSIEIHTDALRPGMRVGIVDDLLATGGTAEAAAKLVEICGAKVVSFLFLIELESLNGRARLLSGAVKSLIKYK